MSGDKNIQELFELMAWSGSKKVSILNRHICALILADNYESASDCIENECVDKAYRLKVRVVIETEVMEVVEGE